MLWNAPRMQVGVYRSFAYNVGFNSDKAILDLVSLNMIIIKHLLGSLIHIEPVFPRDDSQLAGSLAHATVRSSQDVTLQPKQS
jgi:hypothetical protein